MQHLHHIKLTSLLSTTHFSWLDFPLVDLRHFYFYFLFCNFLIIFWTLLHKHLFVFFPHLNAEFTILFGIHVWLEVRTTNNSDLIRRVWAKKTKQKNFILQKQNVDMVNKIWKSTQLITRRAWRDWHKDQKRFKKTGYSRTGLRKLEAPELNRWEWVWQTEKLKWGRWKLAQSDTDMLTK